MRDNFAAESFYIMKLWSRLFVPYCRNCPKDDKFRYFVPILRKSHFEEVRGGAEPWLTARWKASVEFLLSVIEVLFRSLTAEPLQGEICQNSLLSGGGRLLEPRFHGEGVVPGNIF